MTLSVKLKLGNAPYACAFVRDNLEVLRLEPGEEGEITIWSGSPITMKEVLPKNVAKAAPALLDSSIAPPPLKPDACVLKPDHEPEECNIYCKVPGHAFAHHAKADLEYFSTLPDGVDGVSGSVGPTGARGSE